MEIKIINETKNPLFNRKELKASVEAKIIPTKQEVAKTLSEKYSVDVGAIRVIDIQGSFGSNEFVIKANVYESNEARNITEVLTKKEKEEEAKAAEPAEETKEEAKEEAPAEPEKVPSEEAIGINSVEEAKKIEEDKTEEDKKEKEKTSEEKQNE